MSQNPLVKKANPTPSKHAFQKPVNAIPPIDNNLVIKEAQYIDLNERKNRKQMHFIYISLVIVCSFSAYKYAEKITAETEKIIYKDKIVYKDSQQASRTPSSIESTNSSYKYDLYTKRAIEQKIDEKYEKIDFEENQKYHAELKAYRDAHPKDYSDTWEYRQISLKNRRQSQLIRGQKDIELCEQTKDDFACRAAENFKQNKAKFSE